MASAHDHLAPALIGARHSSGAQAHEKDAPLEWRDYEGLARFARRGHRNRARSCWCWRSLPLLTQAFDQRYLLSIGTRIVIWSIAAVSLNMILGYGGLVSFGHAVFFGIGGYAVGILSAHGVSSGWIQWPVALIAATAWAALIGALSLRTRGLYFIMITLAFAQLVYYVGGGLEAYGGDDGLNISRSRFPGLIDLRDKATFYWLCFALLCGTPVVLRPLTPIPASAW